MTYRNSSWTGRAAHSLEETCGVRSTYAQIEPMPDTRPPGPSGAWLYALIVIGLALAFWADAPTPPLQAEQLTAATVADVAAEQVALEQADRLVRQTQAAKAGK